MRREDLLEDCPLNTLDLTPDEKLLAKLSVAVGILADRAGQHSVFRAVTIAFTEWTVGKGWAEKSGEQHE